VATDDLCAHSTPFLKHEKQFLFPNPPHSTICFKLWRGTRAASWIITAACLMSTVGTLKSQAEDPMPAECAGAGGAEDASSFSANCSSTSSLWSSDSRHIPNPGARSIRIRANFIILQKIDGTGNFQDIPEHRAFLDDWFNNCNNLLANLYGTSDCSPLVTDSKIQIVPNWIFLPDPNPTEFNWNNDNNIGIEECPSETNWWLSGLDASISANPSIPKGINVYLTVDGSVYNEMVVLGTRNNPETPPNNMGYTWCSEQPKTSNLNAPSRVSVANLYLKYWWFRNTYPNGISYPFSETRQWLVAEGGILAHEFGHSLISKYVHSNFSPDPASNCTNHLMHQKGRPVSTRNVLPEIDAGHIHRNLAITNLRQFIDCSESYSPTPLNQSGASTTYDRIVSSNETWDLNMRVYSNITVKTGATLTVTCKVLMAEQGLIKVERGARLIVDGGTITRANTCSPTQYWGAIAVAGNSTKIQPVPTGTLATNDAGVVILKNQGMLEGAVVGVTTKRIPSLYEPEYWGGVVDANDFTIKDCRKGVEFVKYDLPNRSQFKKTGFIRTSTGSSYAGVTIWDTDGILFDECTFTNMNDQGIRAGDAIFNVKQKNKISGSQTGILAGASHPLSGEILVGVLGAQGATRNVFENNVVGIHATANTKVIISSNDFDNSNFGIAFNGTTNTKVKDNNFSGSAAGTQFENTGVNLNENACNQYLGTTAGVNIYGLNTGYTFNGEDFNTNLYDLFIEGDAVTPGQPPLFQGSFGAARWNYFTSLKAEQIKTSTVVPFNVTNNFYYFHPDPVIDPRLKPKCPLNESCTPQSNFFNFLAGSGQPPTCSFPEPPGNPPCLTRPCLEAVRYLIGQQSAYYATNPSDSLEGILQGLFTKREYITDELIRGYIASTRWDSVEMLLDTDLNPANRRRLIGAKLEQKQYVAADSLLQLFPQSTPDDQYFVQVQTINTARLSNGTFALSNAQKATLLNIATASSPEAGYAQTLLGILTDTVFMPRLPDFGGERGIENTEPAVRRVLEVSPNPVGDLLQVRFPLSLAEQTIELRSLTTGTLVQSVNATNLESIALPVQHLPSGAYLIVLRTQDKIVEQQKIIVQH
jgi:hypothetical protein